MKAPVHPTPEIMRNAQLIKARVIWSTKPMAVVPVLAVTRQGGQTFVYVARKQPNGQYIATETPVTLGDTVGNTYSVTSGLNAGDKVMVSSTQFLVNGMPVIPDSRLSIGRCLQAMRLMAHRPLNTTKEGSSCLLISLFIGRYLQRFARC